eukprot:5685984-Pleurochrysis_carterae.AAC.1
MGTLVHRLGAVRMCERMHLPSMHVLGACIARAQVRTYVHTPTRAHMYTDRRASKAAYALTTAFAAYTQPSAPISASMHARSQALSCHAL